MVWRSGFYHGSERPRYETPKPLAGQRTHTHAAETGDGRILDSTLGLGGLSFVHPYLMYGIYEPQLEAEALSEACGVPTVRLDHAACFGQPPLVLVGFHEIQQVGVAGELDQIRMGGDQGLAPVDERVVRGEEIGDVAAFLVGYGVSSSSSMPNMILLRG